MTRYVVAFLAGVLITEAVRADSPESRFLTGLRQRHLYRLAEQYGTQRWQRSDLSDRERAELTIALALVYSDQALAAPPESRDAAWAKADGVCASFIEQWPQNPRRAIVEVQRALVSLARGQQLRDEAAGTAAAEAATARALEYLRAAVRQLSEIATAIDRQLVDVRLHPDADRPPDALSPAELESLSANLAFQLARAQRQLGLCYPPRSPDRDDALLQAVDRLKPLSERSEPDELAWNARVELAACERELGRLQSALELLEAWSRQNPPPDTAASLVAERVRLLLAAGRIPQAIEAANEASANHHLSGGELSLARLEATLAAWQAARQAGQQGDVRDITAQVEAIRQRYGPFWARRAQLLVGAVIAGGMPENSDAQSLLLAAEHQYFNGHRERALASYDRASELLEQQQLPDQAFAAAMTAAAIERNAGRLAQAADRYRKLALRQPGHSRAGEAHRLAILCAADLLRDVLDANRPLISSHYETLLDEHLARWSQGPIADEVRVWKGQWLVGQRDWPAAIATLQSIPHTSPRAADAVGLIVSCYEQQLQPLEGRTAEEARRKRTDLLAAATQQSQPVITGANNRWPDSWSSLQRTTALALARMHLRHSSQPSEYAERLLTAALRGPAADGSRDQAWETAARGLLVAALARNGKASEAQAIVLQLSDVPPAELLELLAAIDTAAASLPASVENGRQALGRLALEVVQLVDANQSELDSRARIRLGAYRAAALAATGDRAAAVAEYSELAAQAPDDGDIQERFATLLAASDSPDDLRQSLAKWRQVEKRSHRGGQRWRRARTARIELLAQLGDQAEADKLLRLTRLLYPDWEAGTNSAQ
jgi:hypothetical protein